MRELTLIETGYLAGGLLLSLVLPLLASLRGPRDPSAARSCVTILCAAQLLLALAGLSVLASAALAPYAAAGGLAGWTGGAFVLRRRQARVTRVA
jgi:hypothetical protein